MRLLHVILLALLLSGGVSRASKDHNTFFSTVNGPGDGSATVAFVQKRDAAGRYQQPRPQAVLWSFREPRDGAVTYAVGPRGGVSVVNAHGRKAKSPGPRRATTAERAQVRDWIDRAMLRRAKPAAAKAAR